MKFKIEAQVLNKYLSCLNYLFSKKQEAIPILSCILIDVKSDYILFSATDLENGMEIKTQDSLSELEEGRVVVDGVKFIKTIKSLEGEIFFELLDNVLNIICGSFIFNLNIIQNSDDFPVLTTKGDSLFYKIDRDVFIDRINKVIFSVSKDINRYVLSGVLFSYVKKKLKMISTDGMRLSLVNINKTV